MSRLLIVSHDLIGERMTGVGIRYFEIACALGNSHEVVLAAPAGSHLPARNADRLKGSLRLYQPGHPHTLADLIRQCDILFAYPDIIWQCRDMLRGDTPAVVVDGYDITLLEHLELDPTQSNQDEQLQWLIQHQAMTRYVIGRGDLFLAATERQRDWWLGALATVGRINPLTYQADPTLRKLVDLLPYGLPDTPPRRTRQVLRGVVKGIGADDKIVLWGGGIWEWLDPLTLIRAATQIAPCRPDVKFVFPGVRHPAGDLVRAMPMQQQAINLARELGVLDQTVFMGDWASYDDWPNYLIESDVGVSLHRDHLEARLSARTRVMSYVWAGLPMVLSEGDELATRMEQAGVARLVRAGDVDSLVDALLAALAQDKTSLDPKFNELRAALQWPAVVQPLRQFCDRPSRAADFQSSNMSATQTANHSESSVTGEQSTATTWTLPDLQFPAPTSWIGRLLKPLLDLLVLWYVRALMEQQNRINAAMLHMMNHLRVASDDTRQHLFGLAEHVRALQAASDDTRQQTAVLRASLERLDTQLADAESLQTDVIAAVARRLNNLP